MDASEQVTVLANAISEGINYVAYIRSLQAEPPAASSGELLVWRKAMDDFQSSLKAIEEGAEGHVLETSLRVSGTLISCIQNVCDHLLTIEPGAPLPATLFNLVDLAWAEMEGLMGRS